MTISISLYLLTLLNNPRQYGKDLTKKFLFNKRTRTKSIHFYDKKLNTSGHKFQLRAIYYAVISYLNELKVDIYNEPQSLHQQIKNLYRLYMPNRQGVNGPFTPSKTILKRKSIFMHTVCPEANSNHLSLKPGYFPGFFYLNESGYSGWANKRIPSSEYVEFIFNHLSIIKRTNKYSTIPKSILKNEKKFYDNYILILLQTPGDTVSLLQSRTTEDLINYWIGYAKKYKLELICKLHPKGIYNKQFIDRFHPYIVDFSEDLFNLIDYANMVVTQNSGAGLQGVLRGKKVILHANADFSNLCIENKNYYDFDILKSLIDNFVIPSDELIAKTIASINFCLDYPQETKSFLREWLNK